MGEEKYMEGECHVFAVALHRNLGTGFLLLCERSHDYRDATTGAFVPSVHHVYAVREDGILFDIRGEYDPDDVTAQWLSLGDDVRSNPFTVVRLNSENELARFVSEGWELPLTSYTDGDVAEAWWSFLHTPVGRRKSGNDIVPMRR